MTEAESRRLVAELEALPEYKGWEFIYDWPDNLTYRRGTLSVYFTPDWDKGGTLPIEVSDDDGHHYAEYNAVLPLPRSGRTGQKLFNMVRPTLEKLSRPRLNAPPRVRFSHQSSHATKKRTAAQLDREIAQALRTKKR